MKNSIKINKKSILFGVSALAVCAVTTSFCLSNNNSIDGSKAYNSLFIDGKQVVCQIYQSNGENFVPLEKIANYFGDTVDYASAGNTIKLKHNGKEYTFYSGASYYMVDGVKKPNVVVEENGVNVTVKAIVKRINNGSVKLTYVPLNVLINDVGYDIKSVDEHLYLGEQPSNFGTNDANVSKPNTSVSNSSNVTDNMKKNVDTGWICPQLPDNIRSVDDVVADSQALQKYLEFSENGSTSAVFDVINNGAPIVTLAVGTENSYYHSGILIKGFYGVHNANSWDKKTVGIEPQLLKFYFPNSWEWIDSQLRVDNGKAIDGKKYIIDGRETWFNCKSGIINIIFSTVGGKLGDTLNYNVPVSDTIGQAYSISQGYWCHNDDNTWSFKDNSNMLKTGWIKDAGYWYYLGTDGIMKTGWIKDGGNYYYLWSNGQLATNTVIDGYTVNADGVLIN